MSASNSEAFLDKPTVQWRRLLFTSHFSASWGERMWEFSSGLLLLKIAGTDSLELPARLGFAMYMTGILLGPKIGSLVDRGSAISAPLLALACQSVGIGFAALSAALALLPVGPEQHSGEDHAPLLTGPLAQTAVIGFSCMAKLASTASKLAVEKRWAKALAAGDSSTLATLNGQLRRIDLTCKTMAPVLAGAVMEYVSPAAAGGVVAFFNFLAWPVEMCCLLRIHRDPWCRKQLEASVSGIVTSRKDQGQEMAAGGRNWQLYFSQTGLWPSAFALSLLHLTVLSFGQLMVAYVMTLGVSAAVIAVYRCFGEVFGLTATVVAPRVVSRLGPERSATLFIWLQLLMLVPSAIGASRWARQLHPLYSSALLVGGVAVSRLGLWGFDLSTSQLIQERVRPESALATVSGVQNSLESIFGAGASVAGMLLPEAGQFQYLAFGSVVSVFTAASLHTTATRCNVDGA